MQDMDRTIASGNTIKLPIAQMRPHLIVLYPQNQFKQIPLEKGTVVLGRGQDADIRMDDELVSRRHCAITFDGDGVTVKDLGSTNGTFVDGSPISESKLEDHNRLQIGKMVLKIDFKDASEEAFDRELYEAATMDPLTKISNRRTFMDRSLGELALARRNNYYVHAIMVDADHFKRVNDTWGHQCGDMVLKEIARILKEEKRESDLLARYGVERHRFSWKDTIIPVTISLGLASRQGENIGKIEELIAECDRLLYIAKESGRNQVAF